VRTTEGYLLPSEPIADPAHGVPLLVEATINHLSGQKNGSAGIYNKAQLLAGEVARGGALRGSPVAVAGTHDLLEIVYS
jgi:hypothetical protein